MHRSVSRFAAGLTIVILVLADSALALSQSPAPSRGGSGLKRVVWTVVGAGIGFGAGVLVAMVAFEDSVDSDRKGWTTAVVGAALGGIIGNLAGAEATSRKQRNRVLRFDGWPLVLGRREDPDPGLEGRIAMTNRALFGVGRSSSARTRRH